MIRSYTLLLICLCGLYGCEEIHDFSAEGSFQAQLVVEGVITSEKKRHEIRLSTTFHNLNDSPPPVDDALVAIFIDNGDPILLNQDPNQPGVYLTDSMRALFGKLYGLYILHNGEEYTSFSSPNFGAPVESLHVIEKGNDVLEYVYTESAEPSMMEVTITWPETIADEVITKKMVSYYYTLDVIDINKIFASEKEPLLFPTGATILRRKFSLTQDHQEFLRSFLSEVEWRGSIFDVAPGNVRTNINGGALGYFWVSIVRSDQQIVN